MKKDKEFNNTRFSADVLREALRVQKEIAARLKIELDSSQFKVDHDDPLGTTTTSMSSWQTSDGTSDTRTSRYGEKGSTCPLPSVTATSR